MKLDFQVVKSLGAGKYADVIHFSNTQAQVFSITGGILEATPSEKIDYGNWDDLSLLDTVDVSPDSNMSHFEIEKLQGFGIIGNYKSQDSHKLIIHEFAFEMGEYISSGSIKHSLDNPISSFSLTLENPDIKNPEHPGNVAINEKSSLISPGSKISFDFSMGDSDNFELGSFYVDRSNFSLLSETIDVEGRNLIGKALKDQSLDENAKIALNNIHAIVEELLIYGGIKHRKYIIEMSNQKNWFDFKANMSILDALEEVFKASLNWKIEELTDGTIVAGSPNFYAFTPKGSYVFYKKRDIFSRNIVRDDIESYRRVCVHDKNFNLKVYEEVRAYSGWNLQENKTLYIQVADGTREIEAYEYAKEVAKRLEYVGKIESFTGPLRPYLTVGDEAIISEENGSESLGLITEITHVFGKDGFYTNFTVDSGGKLGQGRLRDYIGQISKDKNSGNIGYEDSE